MGRRGMHCARTRFGMDAFLDRLEMHYHAVTGASSLVPVT